ncbi:MAG TPA: BTAD domain-containing putative transcriptional regulator, partial [Pseudonocardia sp.]|nr:BTAD domain-containing putative transcriptional regulator [Pseudonocardia sp.]
VAWRASPHAPHYSGEADPLHGYLAAHILAGLPEADARFLVRTSVLDAVTVDRAVGLGEEDAPARLAALRARHLPVAWTDAPPAMRAHPRFREFLAERLARRPAPEVRAVQRALGRLLAGEGRGDEAVDVLLAAGEVDAARDVAESAIEQVAARMDGAVVDRWLAAFAHGEPRPAFVVAELMRAIADDDYAAGCALGDRLAATGALARIAAASERAAALLGWCYFHFGRVDDTRRVIGLAPSGPSTDAVRYCLTLSADAAPDEHPPPLGGPLDGLVARVHYHRGRLDLLTDQSGPGWGNLASIAPRASALRAMGRSIEARELVESAGARAGGKRVTRIWQEWFVSADLQHDAGQDEQALASIEKGRAALRERPSLLLSMLCDVAEAKVLLRPGRGSGDPVAACAVLDRAQADPLGANLRFIHDYADTWYGLALLRLDDPVGARERLHRAARAMTRGRRELLLPVTAAYLAEAHWRLGDADAADRAAELALVAADRQGSRHQLLQALADVPGVVSRRLDSAGPDSAWHEIGRALRTGATGPETHARVEVREFGECRVLVDGTEATPRLGKAVVLLAYLAARRPEPVTRAQVLAALFEERSADPAGYLRQVLRSAREVLPPEISPRVVDGRVQMPGAELTSESGRVERHLRDAARAVGDARAGPLREALSILDRGTYLPGAAGPWVEERRRHLDVLGGDALLDLARAEFDAERYLDADEAVMRLLARDPYREAGWRLAMRVAEALGDVDDVVRRYRRAEAVLAELGTRPSASTRALLDRLRR